MEAGCSILGKTAQPRFPEVQEHSCQHEADTVVTGRTKWPAEGSPPQISSGKSTSLTRGSHVQGFVEPRIGSNSGNHLLWYLLWSYRKTEARKWVGLTQTTQADRASALSARLSLPPGTGHMRAWLCQVTDVKLGLLNFTTSRDPRFIHTSPQLPKGGTVKIPMLPISKFSPWKVT